MAASKDEAAVVRSALVEFMRTNRVAADGWTPALAARLRGWLLDHMRGPGAKPAAVAAVARLGLVPSVAALGRGDRAGYDRIAQRIHRSEGLARELIGFALHSWMEALHGDADHAGDVSPPAVDGALERGEAGRTPRERRRPPVRPVGLDAGAVFRDALRSGGEGPEMAVVPAGEFMMGSEEGGGRPPARRHRPGCGPDARSRQRRATRTPADFVWTSAKPWPPGCATGGTGTPIDCSYPCALRTQLSSRPLPCRSAIRRFFRFVAIEEPVLLLHCHQALAISAKREFKRIRPWRKRLLRRRFR